MRHILYSNYNIYDKKICLSIDSTLLRDDITAPINGYRFVFDSKKWGYVRNEEHYNDLKEFGAYFFEGIFIVDRDFFQDKRHGYSLRSLYKRVKL